MAEKGKCQVCSKMSDSRCSWCRVVFYCSKEHQKQDWEGHKAACTKKKYVMSQNEKLGRHLLATEDIKPDYILLKDKAILLSIKANSLEFTPNKICLGCYKEIKVDEEDDDDDDEDQEESEEEEENSDSSASESNGNSKIGGGGGGGDTENRSNSKSVGSNKKICEKCELPICSQQCSSQYFHKAFECRLIYESLPLPLVVTDDSQQVERCSSSDGIGNRESTSTPTTTSNTSSSPNTTNANGNTGPNYSIRETIVRNLIYFRAILLKYVNPKQWDEMMSLQSNEESRRNMPDLERTTRVFSILKRILGQINHPTINQVSKPDVHKILGILDINALHFNISSAEAATTNRNTTLASAGGNEVELSALFPIFSLLEHSCRPNLKYYLSPSTTSSLSPSSSNSSKENTTTITTTKNKNSKYLFEIFCRSSVKIKKGENLSVSYVNLMWNTEKRREFLKKERFFWCECPRCKSPDELGSNFSTIICPQEGCKAFSVPVSKSPESNSADIHWKCTKCSKFTAMWQVKKLDARLCEMVGRAKPSLESYKQLLDKMDELVHPDYYLSFVLNHSLVQMYGVDEATIHDTAMLEEKVGLCNRLLNLIKKIDPGLAKLNIYTAVIYYEMQSAILAMAGGEVDDDFKTLRHKPETVKLAKLYLLKCIDCFKYEYLDLPENKLRNLAYKKMEYLDFILTKLNKSKKTVG